MKRNYEYRQLIQLLSKYMRPYWPQMLLSLLLYLIASLLTAAQPMVTAPVLEVAVHGPEAFAELAQNAPTNIADVDLNNIGQYLLNLLFPQQTSAWNVIVTVALLYLAVSVALYTLNFLVYLLGIWIRVRAGRGMQAALFSHVLGLSLDFFNRNRTGELISRLEKDTDAVVFGLEAIVRSLVVSTVLVALYGGLLLKTSLRLSLFVVAAAFVQYVFVQLIKKPTQRRVREQFNVQAELASYFQEVISNIRVVKSFVAESYESARLAKLSKKAIGAILRFSFFKNIDEPVTFIINSVVNVAVLLFAANEFISGRLSTTGFFLYLYVGRAVLDPLTTLARTLKVIQTTVATSERVQEFFDEVASVVSGSIVKTDFVNSIEFENVSFAYKDASVLENINLSIPRGKMVALVGQSGAGKSTITDLVLRFYDPKFGRITVDGQDVRNLDLEAYRGMIGVVSQDNILFNASIAQNIAYPDETPDMQRVRQASQVANASEFVEALSEGYDSMVGDRGVLLSGGQKQRITIARAVYHQPRILVLDEATSALDTEAERQVQQAIDNIIKDTTAIVIAHRLSTVIHADNIVVMENGRILDQGGHAQLYARSSEYKHFCDLQFGETHKEAGLEI
ncbi:MAG TPA: ABC transporter ATP-binding protein [Anaerolineales bacterium]|nr:ABC transporter ATP-binding protein [Anaerolineales bacterium]HRQ92533.1 ABC transporter ATP-binding protein [Anaerolineales bacterium]